MSCNNYFDMTDQGDSFETWYGLRGPAGPQGPAGAPGEPGTNVELRGPVATTSDLPATASSSEMWLVGSAAPYHGWFYNGTEWEDAGEIAVGPAGPQGETGVTFTPAVSISGVISWTNDGGLPNPESVNIRGPQGPQGRGVATGGSAGQVLKKRSATNYDTEWATEDKCNSNLLGNWYFVGGGSQQGYGVFPVNQRGQTSYTGAVFGIDRWKCSSAAGSVTLQSGKLVFSSSSGNADLRQLIPVSPFIGKELTFSVLLDSGLFSVTGTIPTSLPSSETTVVFAYFVSSTDGGGMWLRVNSSHIAAQIRTQNTAVNLIAAKVELGSAQTLAHQENGAWVLNEIPDYETELLRCKTSTADPSDTYANGSVEFGNNIGIVQNTDTATQNISAGQYVIWKGALYTASSAITSGTTLSTSNLTAVSGGGLNALNSLIVASVPSKSDTMPSAAASFTLNIPNNARFLMCASDSSLNRCALFHVISFAAGTVLAAEIGTSNFTFDTSTINRLKVTMSSSGQVALSVWAISGSKASLNSVYFVT